MQRGFGETIDIVSSEGRKLLAGNAPMVRFRGRTDKRAIGGERRTKITLSPFPNPGDTPVTTWGSSWPEKTYTVGLYDHADFNGSLEYVRHTGAKYVLTDSRSDHAYEFANAIRAQLGIEAMHSAQDDSVEWGN